MIYSKTKIRLLDLVRSSECSIFTIRNTLERKVPAADVLFEQSHFWFIIYLFYQDFSVND